MQAWLAPRRAHIEVFYLLPHTPEANPDEVLNRDSKTELRSRPAATSVKALRRLALDLPWHALPLSPNPSGATSAARMWPMQCRVEHSVFDRRVNNFEMGKFEYEFSQIYRANAKIH